MPGWSLVLPEGSRVAIVPGRFPAGPENCERPGPCSRVSWLDAVWRKPAARRLLPGRRASILLFRFRTCVPADRSVPPAGEPSGEREPGGPPAIPPRKDG